LILQFGGLKRGRTWRGNVLPLIQTPFSDAEFGNNRACLSRRLAATANRRSDFYKRSQLFIRADNETLSIVAMRVCNPDRSLVGINR
jgi:hypothetical protein